MYLKKLEIQGFKSFAEKTKIEFTDGITSVVGPNGSGKSNISDSIRWVLGEQSAKSLRGGKMEDVIFAGTEHRKSLGFAEVSLTINNQSKILPLDFSEVTVTRRVFRSGEGEYLINKTPCRLKDIHELFMDTGIGKDGYSIIGQGRVDEILSTRSEDRRAIFEEASGISKYKTRKYEAEKKLELTQTNLLRINDIVSELEEQLIPLEQQAETAKKYLAFRDSLKEIEVSVFIENITRLKIKLKEIDENIQLIEQNIENENSKLQAINDENSESVKILRTIEEELEKLTKEFYEHQTALERINSEININKEKSLNLNNNNNRLVKELEILNSKSGGLSFEIKENQQKLQNYSNKLENDTKDLEKLQEEYKKITLGLDEGSKKGEELNKTLVTKIGEQTDLKLKLSQNKNMLDNLNARNYNINTELTQCELEKIEISNQKNDSDKVLLDLNEQLEVSKERSITLKNENIDLKERKQLYQKKQSDLKNEIHLKSSRKNMLQNMESNLEGYYKSVKEIIKETEKNPSFAVGIDGVLAKIIKVSVKYATAIEISLGNALQNIVTSSEDDAKKAIEYLKKNRLGRATFLPISSVKGKMLDEKIIAQVSCMDGFIGLASNLVEYDTRYQGIIYSLLGKVIIVQNLDKGVLIARKFNYSFRIVTLEGDVISTSGSMAGGSNDNKEAGMLNRSAEINDITSLIKKLMAEEAVINKNLIEITEMLKEVEVEILEVEKINRDLEHNKIREESYVLSVIKNLSNISDKLERLKKEKENFSDVLDTTNIGYSQAILQLEAVDKQIFLLKDEIEKHFDKNKEVSSQKEALTCKITDLKVSISALCETTENHRQMMQRFLNDTDSTTQSISIKNDEIRNNNIEIEKLEKTNILITQNIEKNQILKEEAGKYIEEKSKIKKEFEEKTSKLVVKLQEVNNNIHLINEEYARLKVRNAKMEAEIESVQNRLWEEYELTYANAMPLFKEVENIAGAQKLINELRSNIRNLGPINVVSIEEYKKTKERYDFLKNQKADLDNTKEKLKQVIEDLTQIMKEMFIEQFKLISQNFNQVFRELFNGGRADLKIIDMENILESGIDIEVQPPGKKLQNMMLLSGGERAFTAIALLFSILKLRPAPFCLLDEIEAALDDANVQKFANYIKQHTHLTQFLVITHRKGTMETSNALYGVTMQEQGVSNIVSLKLGQNI